jgi:hypothetical protein
MPCHTMPCYVTLTCSSRCYAFGYAMLCYAMLLGVIVCNATQRIACIRCMYACFHSCNCVSVYHTCIYANMHVCNVCMHLCTRACMHVVIYACLYVCMHVCMHACDVCLYVCMPLCLYVCTCVCRYVCM